MSLTRRLVRRVAPRLVYFLTHPRTRALRRHLAELRRRSTGAPHRVHYFHEPADPHSQLVAQVLPALCARYEIALETHLVGPPAAAAAPERARLEAWGRKDAADVAPFYGLAFPPDAAAPDAFALERAGCLLAASIARGDFVAQAARVGAALWQGGGAALEALARELPAAEPEQLRQAVARGDALRDRFGHYLSAMLYYGGEWYWGVDRLTHLERRLQALRLVRGATEAQPPLVTRPDFANQPPPTAQRRLQLEYFPSLRSPYSAIAMRRVLRLAERLPVELVLRPVLPMVMRGLPVPAAKRRYIVLDAKREAEDAGARFGFMCDPVGRPVERGFSLFPFARARGRAAEYLAAFTRAAFAEGVDTGEARGLRHVVESAGLPWDEARAHLDAPGWREELEQNRQVLFEKGLWGVPSFRLPGVDGAPDFCTWGQDRIWLVEAEIRRRGER